jgi:serine/threonine protein kinase/formylglycine-generating enzyme required for sulfatase activity
MTGAAPGAGDLDEFRLVRPLGKGGMGAVYLGHDTVLDRMVAIKLIGARDPDARSRERFLVEARAVARLSHPNVVTIHRVGTTSDGRPYLVQELIRGTSLDRAALPLPWRRVCEIGAGIARGLAAAHRRGILHRDVKPGNVMLDEDGVARLLDFGLAKLSVDDGEPLPPMATGSQPGTITVDAGAIGELTADPSPGASLALAFTERPRSPPPLHATAPGALVGTPLYAAPEIFRGEPATVQSDLYSLGVLLHELVTGEPPHTGADLAALRRAVQGEDARPLAERCPDAPAALAAVIDGCLAREPAARPASADAVAHALDQIVTGAPARAAGNPYRGLRAFDAEHRADFFGRGGDVAAIVDRLRGDPLVAIAGDSGIGKSSLVKAGVVPAISAGGLGDRRRWRAVMVAPGRRPFAALCDALAASPDQRALPASELVRALRPGAGDGTLVVVDHLEELITLADPDEARAAAELLAAIGDGVLGWKAVLVVRGDFLTRVAALPALGAPLARGLHLLRVLSAADVRDAVVGPAMARGVRFGSDAMIDTLVVAADERGGLPLLQFALAELWGERDVARGVIGDDAIARVGGVAGCLARHADGVVRGLAAGPRLAARRVLVRLVTATRTRAVRDRDELVGDDDAATALEALVRGRLVVARDSDGGAASYEIAHEALIARWATLRAWLAHDAGARAARDRLIAASAEWRRLGRPADLLWSGRQLEEVARAEDIGGGERAFLAASRRRLRRQRAVRIALVAGVPALVLTTALIVRGQAAAGRERDARGHQAAAAERQRDADAAARDADARRAQAFAGFAAGDRDAGEAAWSLARGRARDARRGYRDAAARLEAALQIDGDPTRRSAMADVILAHARVAEAENDGEGVAELVHRLAVYDPVRVATVWRQPAALAVTSPGAHVTVRDRGGAAVADADGSLAVALAPGDYTIELLASDGLDVAYPLRLERGETLDLALPLPARAAVPAGYIYVPPGRFLTGSGHDDVFRRTFLSAPPLHPRSTGGYLIARHEVTFADWMVYLRALPADQAERRRPATPGRSQMHVELTRGSDGFALALQPSTIAYRAREGEPLRYADRQRRAVVRWERLPVSGVSFEDAAAYAAWLAATRQVPGARLCTEPEWERAARGADGRPYPGGDSAGGDEANLDETYGRRAGGYGPDEVGAHPASRSPFGADDMVGNVWEWVASGDGAVLRGGGWYHGVASALAMNREPNERSSRHTWAGVRICADAPAAR